MKAAYRGFVVLAGLALASCAGHPQTSVETAQSLVDRAVETVERFSQGKGDLDFAGTVAEAKGVVVMPRRIRASFIFGAEGGEAVLLARGADGTWSHPAFYALAGASFGFQAGVQDVETVLVIRNDKALDAVLKHQAKFGPQAGLTIGIFGGGVESATTANLDHDILAFSRSIVGAHGGVSLDGGALVRRKDLNEAYYGKGATPRAIVIDGAHANAKAEPLRAALANF